MKYEAVSLLGAMTMVALSSLACESSATSSAVNAPASLGAPPSLGATPPLPIDPGVVMPTPGSVTFNEPGGDAPDKEAAALMRLATSTEGGFRPDRWDTLRVRLIDPKEWRRVRVFGTPTRATFRYGDDAYALAAITYEPSEGPSDPRSCLAKFMRFADDMASSYDIQYEASPVYDREQTVDDAKRPMAVELVEGKVSSSFMKNDYVGAVVAYQSFPDTCLVQSFAAVATNHVELARRVRDAWVNQAAPLLAWSRDVGAAPAFDAR